MTNRNHGAIARRVGRGETALRKDGARGLQCPVDAMDSKLDCGLVLRDRYRLAQRSHRDAFGEIWFARDTRGERTVVVRAFDVDVGISPGSSTAVAALQKQLSHDRCASVVELFSELDRWFLVSELVPGLTLEELVAAKGRLSVSAASRLAADLSEGLRAIHEAGGVHGRLAPNCVKMVGERATIVDVGLGMLMGDESEDWRSTIRDLNDPMLGFLSPEQAAGEGPPTAESDVWALGAILYFALHARTPFAARTRPELSVATARTILPLEATSDRKLGALIAPCLAREPALRPTIDEVVDAASSALHSNSGDQAFTDVSTPGASLSLVDALERQRRSSPVWNAPRPVLFGGIFVTFLLLGLVLRSGGTEGRAAASAGPQKPVMEAPPAPSASTSASASAVASSVVSP